MQNSSLFGSSREISSPEKRGTITFHDQETSKEIVSRSVVWSLNKTTAVEKVNKNFKYSGFTVGPFQNCCITYHHGTNSSDSQSWKLTLDLGDIGIYADKEEIVHVIAKMKTNVGVEVNQDCLMRNISNRRWFLEGKNPLVFSSIELQIFAKRLVNPSDICQAILKYYSRAFDDQLCTDVTFKIKEEKIAAHTFIVSAMSPVLHAMFQHETKESATREVEIKDMKPETFRQMIRFMYSGAVSDFLEEEELQDLFIAADRYAVELLRDGCEKLLCRNVSEKNVISLLQLADRYSSDDIRRMVYQYLKENSQTICKKSSWTSFMREQPQLAHEAFVVMVTGNVQDARLASPTDQNCKQQ